MIKLRVYLKSFSSECLILSHYFQNLEFKIYKTISSFVSYGRNGLRNYFPISCYKGRKLIQSVGGQTVKEIIRAEEKESNRGTEFLNLHIS
jgi:hypothetical protein